MKPLFFTLFLILAIISHAKTIILKPDGTGIYIKDASVIGYSAGDTLLIDQNISGFYISGLHGTQKDTVVVTASAGVLIGGATNRCIEFAGSSYFKAVNMTALGVSGAIGFKAGGCTNLALENISINTVSVGFMIKTDPASQAFAYPDFIIRDVSIKNCSAENCNNEGFYIGQTSDLYNGYKTPPIIGLTMRNCSTTNTGWDGVQITNAQNCDVSGIKVFNAGAENHQSQRSGIAIQDATTGSFSNMYVDGSYGSGLTIFSCGQAYFDNITLKNIAKMGGSDAVFIDNRYDRGYNLGARQLFMSNVVVQGGAPSPAEVMYIMNGTSNGALPAVQGLITRFFYDQTKFPRIKDNVPNQYLGGTEGVPDTGVIVPPPDTSVIIPPPTAPKVFFSVGHEVINVYYTDGKKDTYTKTSTDTIVPDVPSPPRSLAAFTEGKSVVLTWDAPSISGGAPITSYKVYRETSTRDATMGVTVNSGLTYTDTTVAVGFTYIYKVTAVNKAGESQPSAEAVAALAPQPLPPAPLNLTAQGGVGKVVLNWFSPDSIKSFKVYRGTVRGFTTDLVATVSTTTYTDADLAPNTYFYTTTSSKNNLESVKSNEVSALVTPPPVAPSAPQNLTAIEGILSVTLNWQAPLSNGNATITGYKIYRGNASGSGTYLTTVTGLTYTDQNLTNGSSYYYTVTAVNSAGESGKSNEVKHVASSFTLPSAPTNFKATVSGTTITLSWAAPSNTGGTTITGYKLYRGTVSGKYNPIKTLDGNTFSAVDGNKVVGTTYYYAILAINSVGEGALSGEISATP